MTNTIRIANIGWRIRICIREYTFFSEAINFIRQCSKFHTVIMLSNFINLIKTIIEMNEFYNFLSTSALKKKNLTLIHSNTYQGVFHPFNYKYRPSQIENLDPTTSLWGPTLPRHHRHYHNIAAITISEKCFTTSHHTFSVYFSDQTPFLPIIVSKRSLIPLQMASHAHTFTFKFHSGDR